MTMGQSLVNQRDAIGSEINRLTQVLNGLDEVPEQVVIGYAPNPAYNPTAPTVHERGAEFVQVYETRGNPYYIADEGAREQARAEITQEIAALRAQLAGVTSQFYNGGNVAVVTGQVGPGGSVIETVSQDSYVPAADWEAYAVPSPLDTTTPRTMLVDVDDFLVDDGGGGGGGGGPDDVIGIDTEPTPTGGGDIFGPEPTPVGGPAATAVGTGAVGIGLLAVVALLLVSRRGRG